MTTFVTSFNAKHYDLYAESMLESVIENWSHDDFRLIVYYDGYQAEPSFFPQASFIEYRNLEEVEDRNKFIQRNAKFNGIDHEGKYNFRLDAVRFCNKVYAYSEVAFEMIRADCKDWLVWLDADTITTSSFTAKDVEKILPAPAEVVHLGRIDIDFSETGFVGWNMASPLAAQLLIDIRLTFDTNEFLGFREWNDAFVFTRLLNIHRIHGIHALNLSEGVRGLSVFENSVLKDYFIHNKGNLKVTAKLQKQAPKAAAQAPIAAPAPIQANF